MKRNKLSKKTQKKINYWPLVIFLPLIIVALFCIFHFHNALADGTYTNQEKIPGSDRTPEFPQYIKNIIGFGYAVIGILAMFMLCIGAYQYLMAAGNISKAENAKNTIGSAVLGLILGLMSWVILFTINPDLVTIKGPSLTRLTGGNTGVGTTTGGNTGVGTTTPGTTKSTADCSNLNSSLNSELNAADNGVPPALLAAFMQRECAPAMSNPNACGGMNSQGLAGGPMQFTPGTWNGLGCAGSMTNRQDALNCAAKKIAQDSRGDYSDAGIMRAAKRYCGSCVHANCGSDNYCEGILANYNVYKNCSFALLIKLFAKNYGHLGEKINLRDSFCNSIIAGS